MAVGDENLYYEHIDNAYLTNIIFPASILTGSISFQDSFKVLLVSDDKEIETVFIATDGEFPVDPWWWIEAEHPILWSAFVRCSSENNKK